MLTGAFMESQLCKLVPCFLYLLLLIHLCPAAPGLPGTQREDSAGAHSASVALLNPFGSGEEHRRLLQSYIHSSLKDGQGGPEISSWEQEVFFLFRLYDFDRSGFLDGLEMMKLLSDYNSHHTPGPQANELVVSTVDFLLQTQDLNQDGLLGPSELLSAPFAHTQEQEVAVEKNLSRPSTGDGTGAEKERADDNQGEIQPQEEEQLHPEVNANSFELIQPVDEKIGQQIPDSPSVDQGHYQGAPVHQVHPEI